MAVNRSVSPPSFLNTCSKRRCLEQQFPESLTGDLENVILLLNQFEHALLQPHCTFHYYHCGLSRGFTSIKHSKQDQQTHNIHTMQHTKSCLKCIIISNFILHYLPTHWIFRSHTLPFYNDLRCTLVIIGHRVYLNKYKYMRFNEHITARSVSPNRQNTITQLLFFSRTLYLICIQRLRQHIQ